MSSPQKHSQTHDESSVELGPPPMPPPPPSFSPPGDETETLPPYTNHIRLASLCRRKREFQAAFDKTPRGRRTWELVWLVLDGTALRVYRPKSQEKKAVENNTDLVGLVRMGSGDSSSTRSTSTSMSMSNIPQSAARSHLARVLEGRRGRGRGALLDQQLIASGAAAAAAPLVSTLEPQLQLTRFIDAQSVVDLSASAPFIEGQARRHRRMDSIAKVNVAPSTPPAYSSHTMATAPYSVSTPLLPSPSTPASASTFVQPPIATASESITLPDFSQRKACRQYHLQHAICMRADAYTKREHVLRFVLEDGKQFIVQLSSRAETISWLQLMSIAAPLSLDLDERPMPEPAHYPRRRPRARARTQRRPSTAPGALGPSTSTPLTTTTTTTTQASGTQGARGSLSAMGAARTIPRIPDNAVDLAVMEEGGEGEGDEEDEEDDDGDEDEDPLIVEEDMDHLPPPRRPVLLRSLSSVEQARRRGIQL